MIAELLGNWSLKVSCALLAALMVPQLSQASISCQKTGGKRGQVCVDASLVSLHDIFVTDDGSADSSGPSIDIQQDVCDEETQEKEPFFDTSLGFRVRNDLLVDLYVVSARHVLKDSQGRIKSQKVRFNNPVIPAGSSDVSVSTFFLDVSGEQKYLVGRTGRSFSSDPGVVRVKTIIILRDDRGNTIRETVNSSFSLGNLDNCNN